MENNQDNDIVHRLQVRANIRRSITTRKSVQEGREDRLADLLDEAAKEIINLRAKLSLSKMDKNTFY